MIQGSETHPSHLAAPSLLICVCEGLVLWKTRLSSCNFLNYNTLATNKSIQIELTTSSAETEHVDFQRLRSRPSEMSVGAWLPQV